MELMGILGVHNILGQEKYLGLPLMIGRAMTQEFKGIKERIAQKLQGWNGKLLSQHGKSVLIRSVIQAIPTFTMACFWLPLQLVNEINSMVAMFWWGGKDGKRKIHWLNWNKLCHSKFAGGQGFKDLRCFNIAMLSKTWWRILQHEELLSHQVLKAKYCDTWDMNYASRMPGCSAVWKGLMAGKDLVDEASFWRVGDGTRIGIWGDKWLRQAPQFRPTWGGRGEPHYQLVASLIDSDAGWWKEDVVTRMFSPSDAARILATPISRYGGRDRIIWAETSNGELTVKSAYMRARRDTEPHNFQEGSRVIWRFIWKARVSPRVQNHIWRAVHGILPTMVALSRRGIGDSLVCPVCGDDNEDIWHIYFGCPLSRQAWLLIFPMALTMAEQGRAHDNFWQLWFTGLGRHDKLDIGMVTCWYLWKNRNRCLHDQCCELPQSLAGHVRSIHIDYLNATEENETRMRSDMTAVWVPPPLTWIKANVDAGYNAQSGAASFGVVLRRDDGFVIASAMRKEAGVASVLLAEIKAIAFGVELAKQYHCAKVVFESDSFSGIQELRLGEASFSPWGALVREICHEVAVLEQYGFSYVRRQANQLAHALAHVSVGNHSSFIWHESLPSDVTNMDVVDANSLSIE